MRIGACCEKCLPHTKLQDCYNPKCTCHTPPTTVSSGRVPTGEDWVEEYLLGEIQNRFVKWDESGEPTRWKIDHEAIKKFIKSLLSAHSEKMREVIIAGLEKKVPRTPYHISEYSDAWYEGQAKGRGDALAEILKATLTQTKEGE